MIITNHGHVNDGSYILNITIWHSKLLTFILQKKCLYSSSDTCTDNTDTDHHTTDHNDHRNVEGHDGEIGIITPVRLGLILIMVK